MFALTLTWARGAGRRWSPEARVSHRSRRAMALRKPAARKPTRLAGELAQAARAALAHEKPAALSGDKVKLMLTVSLNRR